MDYLKAMGIGAAIGGGTGAGAGAGLGALLEGEEYDIGDLVDTPFGTSQQIFKVPGPGTGALMGGAGGAALGAGGGLLYQVIIDLLTSNDKEARVKRAALGEEDLAALKALIEEIDREKRVKRKSGPKYGQRFLRGALVGAGYGLPFGTLYGGGIGALAAEEQPGGMDGVEGGLLGAGIGGLAGAGIGAAGGGLGNMLKAYLEGDLYDRIAER